MNKRIIYNNSDGVSVVMPAPAVFDKNSFEHKLICKECNKSEMTDDEIVHYIAGKEVPSEADHEIKNSEDIPSDRFFRDAWEMNEKKIAINLPKAKGIKLKQFRELRKPLLEKLDLEYLIASETNDEVQKSLVASKKQALRDVTTVTLPDDIDVLRDFIPDILKEDTNKLKL